MIEAFTFTVESQETGERIDRILALRFPCSTRALGRQAVESGNVRVNGRPCLKGAKVKSGDVVTIVRLPESTDQRVMPDASVTVDLVFEDDRILAVNKPAGLPVHPLSCQERGTLMNGLVARFPELATVGDQPLMAGALHRIDTDTSGLVLVARASEHFAFLRAQFVAQTVEKTYLALVEGRVTSAKRLVHDLAHHPAFRGRMVEARSLTAPDRKMRAETMYRPVERIGAYTLLEVAIRTGVTHQIRCQLALDHHPIVNDLRYGARPVAGCSRHFLHAAALVFQSAEGAGLQRLEAPLTSDFSNFLRCCGH